MEKCDVLIVGSGLAGLKAALDLSGVGASVFIVERSDCLLSPFVYSFRDRFMAKAFIAERSNHLTDACGIYRMFPPERSEENFYIRRDFLLPGVRRFTSSRVSSVERKNGRFIVKILSSPLRVDEKKCISCDRCVNVCPVNVPNEFDKNISTRKAIRRAYIHSLANQYVIDEDACTRCGKCADVCPTDAISLDDKPIETILDVGYILLMPGFEEFAPREKEYNKSNNPDVITSTQMERLYAPTGPFGGKILCPSSRKPPKRIAFVQCVGSRTEEHNYCSSACCMYSMEKARFIKTKGGLPDAEIKIFFTDIRAFGKGYYQYAEGTENMGIEFEYVRVPRILDDYKEGGVKIRYQNSKGELVDEHFDIAVLVVGQVPSSEVGELVKLFGAKTNEDGFVETRSRFTSETTQNNVFAAGPIVEPKDIPDSIMEASGAAGEIAMRFSLSSKKINIPKPYNPDADKLGVFICKCGGEITSSIDFSRIREAIASDDIAFIEEINYLCLPDGLERIKEVVKEHQDRLKGILIAACTGSGFDVAYRNAIEEASDYHIPFYRVNLREGAARVHKDATEKAVSLVKGGIALLSRQEPKEKSLRPGEKKAIVVGGGAAGLSAALTLSSAGIPVELFERSDRLAKTFTPLNPVEFGEQFADSVKKLIKQVESDKNIKLHLGCEVKDITGYLGNYTVEYDGKEKGYANSTVVVVATGAVEHTPASFGYGKMKSVMTQFEFDNMLFRENKTPDSVVFIQCVESREMPRNYCSRVCCNKTIMHAREIKRRNPSADVVVLYRDITAYGFYEKEYTAARKDGIIFTRYTVDRKPEVKELEGRLSVRFFDPEGGKETEVLADVVVLATGVDPVTLPSLPTDAFGFAEGLDGKLYKLSPLEAHRQGLLVAGSCRMPQSLPEAIREGRSAGISALGYLLMDKYPSREVVAYVSPRKCAYCGLCIPACPYEARYLDEDNRTAVVIPDLCTGCGTCAMVCHSNATWLVTRERDSMINMIDSMLE